MEFTEITFKINCGKKDAAAIVEQLREWFKKNEIALGWDKLEVDGEEKEYN